MTRQTDNPMNDIAAMQLLGPRERQEDSALHVRLGRGRLIVLADGMGGEPMGHIASMAAVLGFEKGFGVPSDGFENNLTWARRFMDGLAGAMSEMNAAVEAGHGKDGMATTLVAVWADADGLRWINVGDSGIWGTSRSSPWRRPERLSASHRTTFGVSSGLIAGDGQSSRERVARARGCASKVDFHPGVFDNLWGSLVFVASDGLDVLADLEASRGHYWYPESIRQQVEAAERARMWTGVLESQNPQRFLDAVIAELTEDVARDNTTVIALRLPAEGRFKNIARPPEDYEPVKGAPDREVLGPELPKVC